jgi:hypothetical protein
MGRRVMSCDHQWNFETVPCGHCTWERIFEKKDMKRKGDNMVVKLEFYPRDYNLSDILNDSESNKLTFFHMGFETIPRENDFIIFHTQPSPYKIGRVFAILHDLKESRNSSSRMRVLVSGPF